MMRKYASVMAVALAVLASACSKSSSPAPASPSTTAPTAAEAAADGSTLKVTSPVPQSPINNQQPNTTELTLITRNSTSKFNVGVAPVYRFQVFNQAGTLAYESTVPGGSGELTAHTVTAQLEGDRQYSWQVRAEAGGAVGPWSARANFIAPTTSGYIRGSELYDPLISGVTVGNMSGPLTFIPGVGVKLETQLSYISYQLPQTLNEGQFSLLVTGMPTNTKGTKTKLFAMGEGYADIVTNDRRMTVEKRGDPAGIVAWRFITYDDQVDTEGAEREFVEFDENKTYFWEATWRNNRFNLLIREGGVDGVTIYNKGKNFDGRPYDPNPHVLYLGAPVGRTGPDGASVDRAIIRQVWVSARPRPAFANR